jgi:MFS family permease
VLLAVFSLCAAGFVIFLKAIVALVAQPLMGDAVDKTIRKREYALLSNIAVSLTGLSFVVCLAYEWVVFALILQGIALTVMIPALYALTLGVMTREHLHRQAALNEFYSHLGTVVYAVIAGACSLYGYINGVYYVVAIMGLACSVLVMSIRPEAINDHGARGLDTNALGQHLPAREYLDIFRDFRVPVLLATILLFHSANAAMLPLLCQLQSRGDMKMGIMITAVNICISQLTQAPFSLLVGEKVKHWGSKVILGSALVILPLRGIIIVSVLHNSNSELSIYMLSLTQALDGVSNGIYSVVHVLIAEHLMHRTGRFSFLLGAAQTCHYVGDAISNLVGEYIAGRYGYVFAFQFLTALSVVPVILYISLMPPDVEMIFEEITELEDQSTTGLNDASNTSDKNTSAKEGIPLALYPAYVNPMRGITSSAPGEE